MNKKIVFVVVSIIIVGSLSCVAYWKQLSIEEKWLLFNKTAASEYAKALITSQHTNKPLPLNSSGTSTPDDLIDMVITAKSDVVTFGTHDQDHFFVVAYSHKGAPPPVEALSQKNKQLLTWRKLQGDWYALNIEKKIN